MFGKMTKEKIEKIVKKIILKKFKIKGELVRDNIIEEYGIPSIGIYETFILFEKKFKITLDQDSIELNNFNSIDKLVDLIYGKIAI